MLFQVRYGMLAVVILAGCADDRQTVYENYHFAGPHSDGHSYYGLWVGEASDRRLGRLIQRLG
ncbi:MAG: hypothetical protein R3C49_19840 [Planctomycetaceae bacterium]